MSKRKLSKRSGSVAKMIETLEERRLMSVTPTSIPNASVNDSVYDTDAHVLHVVYFDTASRSLKYQALGNNGAPVSNATATIDNVPPIASCASNVRPFGPKVSRAPKPIETTTAIPTPSQMRGSSSRRPVFTR